jgi:FMN phosphatase YigB (HAD superfamily)
MPFYYCDRARHLICVPYTRRGLHQMARELGIHHCWYHRGSHPHYDIPARRIEAIMADPRVTVVSSRELLGLMVGPQLELRVDA